MTRRSEAPWTTLSTTPIYANKWLSLREDLVALCPTAGRRSTAW
jgi:hypothetical protein